MIRRHLPICFASMLLVLAQATPSEALLASMSLREKVVAAEVIVEGLVLEQIDTRPAEESATKSIFGYFRKNAIQVTTVHKGAVVPGEVLSVLSHSNFVCNDTSKIEASRRYLLMLVRTEAGWVDVHAGMGTWELVPLPGDREALARGPKELWGRSATEIPPIIAWALSKPRKGAPLTITSSGALGIARSALGQSGLTSASYDLSRPRELELEEDIPSLAYLGERAWSIEARRTPDPERVPRFPHADLLSLKVHSASAVSWFDSKADIEVPDDTIRLLLKTDACHRDRYREYADEATIVEVAVAEVDEHERRHPDREFAPPFRLPAARRTVPRGTPGTRFFRVDFPEAESLEPVYFSKSRGSRPASHSLLWPCFRAVKPWQ